jgi:hypothetical protein
MTITDLEPVDAPPLTLTGVPAESLSGLSWLPPIEHFLFASPVGYHLVALNGALRWTIATRYRPNGWFLLDSDLYVQDGCVISQYDLLGLQRAVAAPVPGNACNLRTGKSWTDQRSGPGIDSILGEADRTDIAYSAPVGGWSGATRKVFVLSQAGRVFPLPTNLSVDANNPPFASSKAPDPDLGLFVSGERRFARARYLSADGRIVTLALQPLGIAAESGSGGMGSAVWNALNRAAATPGRWSYGLAPDAAPTPVTVSWLAGGDADAPDRVTLTWVDPATGRWQVLHRDGRAGPFRPARVTAARLADDGLGGPPPRLLTAPCTRDEDGVTFLYALTADPTDAVSLQKFKVTAAAGTQADPWAWVATANAAAASRPLDSWAGSPAAAPFALPATVSCLFSAFQAFDQVSERLGETTAVAWRSFAVDSARTMRECGVLPVDAAAALADVASRWPGPAWLVTASAALYRAYGSPAQDDPAKTVEALRAAGRSAPQVLAVLRVLHGVAIVTPGGESTTWSGAFGPQIGDLEPFAWEPQQLTALNERGAEVTDFAHPECRATVVGILAAVQHAYGLSPADGAALLREEGFLGLDVVASSSLTRADTATTLLGAGFDALEIARAVQDDRYGGWQGTVDTMIRAGCPAADAAQAVLFLRWPGGPGEAIPEGETQQVMAELKSASDATRPGGLAPADLAAAVAPYVGLPTLFRFLRDHYDVPFETLADAVTAAGHGPDGWTVAMAATQLFGLTPTLRWMFATQGADADWADPIDFALNNGGNHSPLPADLAQPMADAGIPAEVTFRWLAAKANWEGWRQEVLDGVGTAYRLTPEQVTALATGG